MREKQQFLLAFQLLFSVLPSVSRKGFYHVKPTPEWASPPKRQMIILFARAR